MELIVSLIMGSRRKKKHQKRNAIVSLIWHFVNAAVFAVFEVAMWYFVPILPVAKIIPAILVCIVILVYAVRGYRQNKKGLKACILLLLALAAFVILESMFIGDFAIWKAILILAVYAVIILAVYYFLWRGSGEGEAPEATNE